MRKNLKKLFSKEMLEYEYKLCGSMQKIADKLDVSVDSIYKYMKLYNVEYEQNNHKYIYSCNENVFNTDTELSFYLAGFIAADGSLQKRKYSKILKICLSKNDLNHLEKIKNLLNSTHPIKEYKVKPSKLITTKNNCIELQIVSKSIFDDLERFNIIPNKTSIYKMPEWLITHSLVNHFMRGYFDGDGAISYCGLGQNRTIKQMNFSVLGTQKFIEQYQNILITNCKLNTIKILKHYSVYKIAYSGNNNVKNIYNFLYKNATIFLNRKQEKFII